MAGGSFDLSDNGDQGPPLAGNALQVGVFRYDGMSEYTLIPNVFPVRIDVREGPAPSTAQFRYILSDIMAVNFNYPDGFEDLWPLSAKGPYVVKSDDRIVVAGLNPDGSSLYLFDGFAQIPQVDVGPDSQHVTFTAVGLAARTFDQVITGRVERSAEKPTDSSGKSDVEIDRPCRFNPADHSVGGRGGFLGNSTPNANFTKDAGNVAYKGGTGLGDFPVFIDPLLSEREARDLAASAGEDLDEEDPAEGATDAGDYVSPWSINDAIKYLLSQPNPADNYSITWPSFKTLDGLLNGLYPDGIGAFDPASATPVPIMVRDYDATNKPLMECIADLFGYAGFVLAWMLGSDDNGDPVTYLKIYRRDGGAKGTPKLLYLAASAPGGTPVNPALNNVTHIHLARDANAIVNAFQVETAQRQVEVSIVLAPGYMPAFADAGPTNRQAFIAANLVGAPAEIRRKYRWYIADECGDGHWESPGWKTTALDLKDIFPPDDNDAPTYIKRYRPGSNTLIARDSDGKPLKADLSISFDYWNFGSAPKVWNGAGTWQSIPSGWHLLHDRLGVEIDVEDVETHWTIGKGISYGKNFASSTPVVSGGKILGVSWWANPRTGIPTNNTFSPFSPVLRLTTVIQDDFQLGITAPKRSTSPTKFARWRAIDAKDHFHYDSIHPSSIYYAEQVNADGSTPDGETPVVVRDDTQVATTHAKQLRSSHEMPPCAGSVTIPYITTYYQIGDRINRIAGRNVVLQTNIGSSTGEAPVYPWVVSVSWDFSGDRQQTILQLSDRRGEMREHRAAHYQHGNAW